MNNRLRTELEALDLIPAAGRSRRCSLNPQDAYERGTLLASEGYDEEELSDWIVDQGYAPDGVTANRVRKAYLTQIARE